MRAIKLINLFILTLFCQIVFSQNNDIVKSFVLRMDKSVGKGLDSTNVTKALKIQFEVPDNYEFKRQIIKGTKDRMSEKDELGYVHERYTQYYKGVKIENSNIRVRYLKIKEKVISLLNEKYYIHKYSGSGNIFYRIQFFKKR